MKTKVQDIELIFLKTEYFDLTIKGKPVHPYSEKLYKSAGKSQTTALLQVDCPNSNILEFYHFSPEEKGLIEYSSDRVFPFFYEQQNYQVIIQNNSEKRIEFYHENKLIRESIAPMSRNKNILTGNINFRNDVGYSEIELHGDGVRLLSLKLEVFPSKIDYQRDYYALLQEVNQEVYNLAYDFLRRTFQNMKLKDASNVSHVEFFSILLTIFEQYKKSFERITKYPHHRTEEEFQITPSSQVKKVNQKSIKWVQKNIQFFDTEINLPTKMPNIRKKVSFNTFENKFVKWSITQVQKKLKIFVKRYKLIYKEAAEVEVIDKADSINKELNFMLTNTFLKDVGELYKIDSLSLVLQMAPGYREVYKYYLMLHRGLSLEGELFNLSMKEIWKLYEYWCFLKMNQILREKYHLIKHNLIDINYSGIYVTLNTSSSSAVQYENSRTGEIFTLAYNKSEGETITTSQKPDNILTLEKKGSDTKYKFIFDAKYRINPAYEEGYYRKTYKTPGPEEDTINAMHRYRDSIFHESLNEINRTIVGAYVLFPYHNEEEFRNHQFYKSIEKVNVGAFPFLPDSVELMTDFLESLIEESALGNYERNILPQGLAEYQETSNFTQNVLVGSVRSREQLLYVLDQSIYYIPANQVRLEEHNLKYIALYLSKGKFPDAYGVTYYGKIKGIEAIKRKDITMPLTRDNGDNIYYLFRLEDWKPLENPILPEGYGISGSHIYTNDMLLMRSKTLPELSIKTIEQWRLWLELTRLKEDLKVSMEDRSIRNESNIKGFIIDGIEVKIDNDSVSIINQGKSIKWSIREFIRNPRGVMKGMFNI